MKDAKFMNVSNCFRTERFKALCEELEKGESVHIYVDCIGHTRSEMVEAEYVSELQKKYGERLQVDGNLWNTRYYLA